MKLQTPDRTGKAVGGRLHAQAVHRDGRTRLDRLFHSVPFHVSKPYWDGSTLLLQVASPTAGLFSGDRMTSVVEVREHAALLLTNQGATRIHPGTSGDAVSIQEYSVLPGGWLEVYPELIIPQGGAGLTQTTTLDVDRGGRAFVAEILAPGRTASGETYRYRKLDWRFRLNYDGIPLVIERAEITAESIPWMFARPAQWKQIYYACVWVVAPEIALLTEAELIALESAGDDCCRVGVSLIDREVLAIKAVAGSSIPLRAALRRIRATMASRLARLNCNPRKL